MMILWGLLKASRGLQIGVLVLACWGVWEGNNALQRSTGRTEGRSEVATTVEKKADTDAKLSDDVRAEVAAGRRGRPDPNRLHSSAAKGP